MSRAVPRACAARVTAGAVPDPLGAGSPTIGGVESISLVQGTLSIVLGLLALALAGYSLVDALRQRADAYPATGNQSKMFWLAILGVAVAIAVVSLFNPLNLFNLIAVVAAGVYLTRVRPAIRAITGRGPSTGGW